MTPSVVSRAAVLLRPSKTGLVLVILVSGATVTPWVVSTALALLPPSKTSPKFAGVAGDCVTSNASGAFPSMRTTALAPFKRFTTRTRAL